MADINTLPGSQWSNVTIPGTLVNASSLVGTSLTANTRQKLASSGPITITTTVAKSLDFIAPCTGTVTNIKFWGTQTLATDDTNYVTFTMTNIGQAGSGTTVMLAATDANTTKTTGGSAVTASVPRNLTLTGTGANLAVNSGDLIRLTVTQTGTLANTITGASGALAVSPTT